MIEGMNTRLQAEKQFQAARAEANENARAACEELHLKSAFSLHAYRLMSTQSVGGAANSLVPVEPVPKYLNKRSLSAAVDELFERQMVAWQTTKGWIYTRQPINPQTKRKLRGDIHLTEKALIDYGDDLYRMYFIANDFDHGDTRNTRMSLSQWRASMAKAVAPNPRLAPPLASAPTRRVR